MEKENLIEQDAALNIIERKELEKLIEKFKTEGVDKYIIKELEEIPKKNVLDHFIEIDVDYQLRDKYDFDDAIIEEMLDTVVSAVQANSDDIFNDNFIDSVIEAAIPHDIFEMHDTICPHCNEEVEVRAYYTSECPECGEYITPSENE